MKRAFWVFGAVLACSFGSRAEMKAQLDVMPYVNAVHVILQGLQPFERAYQAIEKKGTAEALAKDLALFRDPLDKLLSLPEDMGLKAAIDPAAVRALLQPISENLTSAQPDIPAAREALKGAFKSVLDPAYKVAAGKCEVVVEAQQEGWEAYTAGMYLTAIRVQQGDFLPAEIAIWKAYPSAPKTAEEGAIAEQSRFKGLAVQIGEGLLKKGEFTVAEEHITRMAGGWDSLKESAVVLQKKLLVEQNSREVLAMLAPENDDPSKYARAVTLAEQARSKNPNNEETFKKLFDTIKTQGQLATLADLVRETKDCGTKVVFVEWLQKSSESEPFLDDAKNAVTCDPQNTRAQTAFAESKFREASAGWSALMRDKPKDPKAALAKADKVLESLVHATASGVPLSQDLAGRINALRGVAVPYATSQKKALETAAKSADEGECKKLHDRAVGLNKLWDIPQANSRQLEEVETVVSILRSLRSKAANCVGYADFNDTIARVCVTEGERAGYNFAGTLTGKDNKQVLGNKIQELIDLCRSSIPASEVSRLDRAMKELTGN